MIRPLNFWDILLALPIPLRAGKLNLENRVDE